MKTHELLRALYDRSDYKNLDDFAKGAGYRYASSVQRYFKEGGRKGKYLPLDITQRFSIALVGQGTPAITEEEVMALAGRSTEAIKLTVNGAPRSSYLSGKRTMNAEEEALEIFQNMLRASPEAKKQILYWVKIGALEPPDANKSTENTSRNAPAKSKKNET